MMQSNYGYIVNITSIAAHTGFPVMSVYCSSKAAAFSLSESLKLELHQLKKNGVAVTAVCPWHICGTGMFQKFNIAMHLLFPALRPKDVAKKVVRGAYDRKFLLILPSSFRLLAIVKL